MSVKKWALLLWAADPFPVGDPYPAGASKETREAWHRRRRDACGDPKSDATASGAISQEGRINVLRRRYRQGVSLWHSGDAIYSPEPAADLVAEREDGKAGRRRNGSERVVLKRKKSPLSAAPPHLDLKSEVTAALLPYLRLLKPRQEVRP